MIPALAVNTSVVDGSIWVQVDYAPYSALVAADPRGAVYRRSTANTDKAWVRKGWSFLDLHWFDETGDGTPGAADALQAAVDLSYALRLPNTTESYGAGCGPGIFVPLAASYYNCGGTTVTLSHTVHILGLDSGQPSGVGSFFKWNGATTGIEIGATAGGSIIEGLSLDGGFTGTEGEFNAIKRLTASTVTRCQFYNWPGDAVNDDENFGGGATNGSDIIRIYTENCRNSHSGFGGDANAGYNMGIESKANRQSGVLQGSFLGDHYYSCSMNGAAFTAWNTGASGQPVSYVHQSGHWYVAMYGHGAEGDNWCSTNAPSGTTATNTGWIYWDDGAASPSNGVPTWFSGIAVRTGGAYVQTGVNNRSTFIGCYAEGNNPSQFDTLSTVLSPFMQGAKWCVSGGAFYGDKDGIADGTLKFTQFPVALGQTRMASTVATRTGSVHNSGPLAAGLDVAFNFEQGFEADGVTPLTLGAITMRSSTNVVSTAEGVMEFATRTAGGTGGTTVRALLDAPNVCWRPPTDNIWDSGFISVRWRAGYYYTVDAKTAFKINGTTVLNGQMAHQTNSSAATVAALVTDFNALLAKLQGVGLMA